MKPTLKAALSIVFISSVALAQSPGLSVWTISDIRTSTPKEIQGVVPAGSKGEIKETRTAKKGQFIELSGIYYFSSSASISGTSQVAVSGIRLSGVSEKGSKSWSNEPIAVSINSSAGCVEYRFLDARGSSSISQTINGQTIGVDIKDGKLAVTSGIPLPLCLVFPASESSRRKVLAFSGTEVWFEDNGARPLPISKYSIFVDEKAMTARLINHPEPAYPALAKTARIRGTVVLSVTIGANGIVTDVQVFSESNPLLVTGVVDTIKTWQYQPISSGSVPVEVRTRVTVTFFQ